MSKNKKFDFILILTYVYIFLPKTLKIFNFQKWCYFFGWGWIVEFLSNWRLFWIQSRIIRRFSHSFFIVGSAKLILHWSKNNFRQSKLYSNKNHSVVLSVAWRAPESGFHKESSVILQKIIFAIFKIWVTNVKLHFSLCMNTVSQHTCKIRLCCKYFFREITFEKCRKNRKWIFGIHQFVRSRGICVHSRVCILFLLENT